MKELSKEHTVNDISVRLEQKTLNKIRKCADREVNGPLNVLSLEEYLDV